MDAVSLITDKIFSGDSPSRNQLFKLIDGGTLSEGLKSNERVKREKLLAKGALRKPAEKVAWAQMIPKAWYLAGWRPVVVDGGKCDDVGAVVDYIGSGTAQRTGVCHSDGRKYYLVAAARPWLEGTPQCFNESPGFSGSPPPCWSEGSDPVFEELPGMRRLPDETYGSLTLEDIVIG